MAPTVSVAAAVSEEVATRFTVQTVQVLFDSYYALYHHHPLQSCVASFSTIKAIVAAFEEGNASWPMAGAHLSYLKMGGAYNSSETQGAQFRLEGTSLTSTPVEGASVELKVRF